MTLSDQQKAELAGIAIAHEVRLRWAHKQVRAWARTATPRRT